ncbi:L,D-transpeptidase family protein [Cochlodiniinecator piscidefendens]|uniref:L,D-transpeptidase family protein n=1 Tax=Cochlodiniinecator piscidefendens TaxID=2715756 RepID=UPI00140B7AB6|nr:L,D-transpeptidase family protein [Cochlodiniinecator piscidefendens]
MDRASFLKGTGALLLLGACGSGRRQYGGPEVTRISIDKSARRLVLFNNRRVLRRYNVALGFAPAGDKQVQGDGRTPEGEYHIDRRNPESMFHLSLGISYPNEQDRAEAAALGQPPGGDIFIHGASRPFGRRSGDWTAGCIAVTNEEMEEIYTMVETGTPISIKA